MIIPKRPRVKLATLKPRVPMLDTLRSAPRLPSESNDRRAVYNSRRWRDRVAPAKLKRDPVCQRCSFLGLVAEAEHVDHWIPLAQGGDAWADSNHVSLCHPCHSSKTQAEQRGEEPFEVTPSASRTLGYA